MAKAPAHRRKSRKLAVLLPAAAALVAGAAFLYSKTQLSGSAAKPGAGAVELDTPLPPDPAFSKAAAAERVADYPAALERAKATGSDILVFQRGSDWNRLAEKMHRDVWMQDAFLQSLGNGFVLVAVDRMEFPGAPSALDGAAAEADAFRQFTQNLTTSTLPDCGISAMQAESGLTYNRRDDGAWVLKPDAAKNPDGDVLTATVRSPAGAQLLRLDFPPDAALPNGCSGRASNGNFVLSEISVTQAGKPVAASGAWASHVEGSGPPALAVDGIADKPDNCWIAGAHQRKSRTLLVSLAAPLGAGEAQVILTAKSKHKQHIPGCLRIAVLNDGLLAESVQRWHDSSLLAAKNAAFNWQANWNVPRLALLDKDGRAVAADDRPRTSKPSALAKIARDLRSVRVQRDALWAQAEQASGPDKAELLRQGLNAMGIANWAGNGNCYKSIHEAMKTADPGDTSGAVRWLGFGKDPKGGVPWAKPAWNEALDTKNGTVTLTDEIFQEALRRVDKELADPRNKILPKEYLQRIMMAKYHIYKRWKGHEDERFKVQQEIAALDRGTFWGIGGEGYLGEHKRSPMPYLAYGWGPQQVKPGRQTWELTDTSYHFAQPVPYRITLRNGGGKDRIRIKRLVLVCEGKTIAEAQPDKDCGPGEAAQVVCELDCTRWQPGMVTTLKIEVEAGEKSDSQGSFSVEPLFAAEEATAAKSANPPSEAWRERRHALAAGLEKKLAPGDAVLSDAAVCRELAEWELLRRGGDAADEVAARPGGPKMLESLTSDAAWMEEILTTDNRKLEQVLENLRFLHHHCPGFDNPLYRRMGTAIAMQAGEMNRFRLQDRFRHMQQAYEAGYLHPKFDTLTLREMCWAVWLAGTHEDFQFMLDEMQTTWSDYVGACWGIPYIDPNVYGYSVQGWGYVDPWVHRYGSGTGDRPYRVQRQVGGVCGTLSGYGAAAAKVHGAMATTVGQPGHCAYVVRVDDRWATGNDVFGHETNGASVFEGTGFASMYQLYEEIHRSQPRLIAAGRKLWAAHLMEDASRAEVHLLPGLKFQQFRLPEGKLANLPKAALEKSGTVREIDLAAVRPVDASNIGVIWEGQAEIRGPGKLQVSVSSDDSSRLIIAGKEIPTNKGWQDVAVAPGVHPFRLEYANIGGSLALKLDWRSVAPFNAKWLATARQALEAQPENYLTWLDVTKSLEAAEAVPPGIWSELALQAADAFRQWHEAGWAATNRLLAKSIASLPAADRMKTLLAAHRELRQENAPNFFGFNLGGVLDTQAGWLGQAAEKVEFFKQLLQIHQSENPERQRVFGEVMAWGQRSLGGKADTAALFIPALGDFYSGKSGAADKAKASATILNGLRASAEKADRPSHKLWSDLAAKLLPATKPADIFLTDAEFAAAPKGEPFAGELLSAEATLRLSSASPNDRILSHAAVLDGAAPGFFETNAEAKPWVQIALAGDCEVSGIALVNRYESPAGSDRAVRSFPCKISLSTDGTHWTEVATAETPATLTRIDLSGKAPRTRYLRLERQPPADGKPQKMHFRNILIYGRKLF